MSNHICPISPDATVVSICNPAPRFELYWHLSSERPLSFQGSTRNEGINFRLARSQRFVASGVKFSGIRV